MNDSAATGAVSPARPAHPTLAEGFTVWCRIALLSFGGPAGQIAVMHRILVEEKRWLGESRFLHALNFCMLLPGPEAQQLAVYIGWLLHRTLGGFIAGILFVLPGAIAIMALSWIYALYGNVGPIEALFFGLKAAVLAIVLEAVMRIGKRSLRNRTMLGLAAASFVGIFVFDLPFPLIIATAGVIGFLGSRAGVAGFQPGGGHGAVGKVQVADALTALGEDIPAHAKPSTAWALKIGGVLLALWLIPVLILFVRLGADDVFTQIAVFFSQMAVVTFGGAYAVLAYVAQEAVNTHGWLAPGELLDGLGLAETTPGPLILVLQFVGFMAAFRNPGGLDPMLAGVLGAALTTWVTFVPCFLWIFLGAPYVEKLRGNKALAAALSTITAAVVGVMLNLTVWFGLHVLFGEVGRLDLGALQLHWPVWSSLDPFALVLSIAAIVAMLVYHLRMVTVLAASAAIGAAIFYLRP